ncbi:MAG: CSLREA domain-containing protein, partial [Chloroflexi bacterium]|nr:CSLREA domain-containing protein [Chloroflexota bacterium]
SCFELPFDVLRLALGEAVREELTQVWLEHRLRPSGEWLVVPIVEFFDPAMQTFGPSIPPNRFELVWDPDALDPDQRYDLRLRLRDAGGTELTTQEIELRFAGEELAFRGRLDWHTARAIPALELLLAEAGLDPVADLVLWGTESIEAPLDELTLFVASDEDPRYDPPRTFPPAAESEGFFIFRVEEWQSCTDYSGHLVALTEPLPGVPPETFVTNPALVHLPCLELTYDVSPAIAGGCGESIQQAARTITLSPRSLDGSQLLLLSLSGPGEDGQQQLLYTQNQPASGGSYAFTLDLASLPEGVFPLAASLSNVNGEEVQGVPRSPHAEVDETDEVVVDRAPPTLAITYPVEGQALCADPLDGGLLAEGVLADDWGAAYFLEFGVGAQPDVWLAVGDQGADGTLGERLDVDTEGSRGPPGGVYDGRSQRPSTTSWGGPLHRLGGGYEEELTIRAHAADASGAHLCTEVTFSLDARVLGPAADLDLPAFSPNGDGLLETATLTVGAVEPTQVTVEIFPGVFTDLGPSITGPKVRTLATDLLVQASASLPWDGRDDDGAVVPDDSYLLFVAWTDACGNAAEEVRLVHVDTTPPAVAIVSPTPETQLPMIVQIVGAASDWHFDFWSLQVGEGADPAAWIELAGSHDPESEPHAYWNTFGLAGTYTLRLTALDTVGLSAEARVLLELEDRTYLITYLEADPELFSPNGDGRRETTAIRFGLQFDVRLTLTVHDPQGSEVGRLVDDAIRAPGAWIESWDGGAEDDDRYTVRLEAALLADPNVTQTEEIAVDLDRTAPLVDLVRPTPGGWLRSADDVFGTISDQRLASWSLSMADDPGAPIWQEIAAGDANRIDFSFARLTGFAEGDYALRAWAADEAEIEAEVAFSFGIDDTLPAVAVTAPPAGSHLGAILGPIEVVGSVEDDHLALWRLEVGAGAEPTTWMLLFESDEGPAGPTLFTWEVTGAPEGDVTLRLEARDLAGNETTVTLPLVVDNTPPLAAITSPSPDAYVTGPGPVVGTADDDHLVEYRLAVAPTGSQAFSEIGVGTSPVVDATLATWTALPPDGPYDLRLAVRDQVGHEPQVLVQVIVDTLAPSPPMGLAVELVDGDDASLTWDVNSEPDLAGYHVFRSGTRLTATPIPDPAYLDADLGEGIYLFTVTAVDHAGHESEPSAPALLRIDHTPPLASIFEPLPGERVAGLFEVRGTAWSPDDFAEYRLWAIDETTGGSTLLAQVTAPVQAGPLGQWSTLGLPDGAPFRLRLEAEDLTGNLASHEVAVTVDNLPPAPPTGLVASVTGSNVHLTWNANSEPDFAAYLLFRDGEPRGGELVVRVYDDLGVPDGTYAYVLYALDQAGNLSGPSVPRSVTIDTRAPHATIVEPPTGTAFDGALYVLATSPDEDIAQVRFQFRPAGTGAWLEAGAPVVAPPWDLVFDPASFEPPLAEGGYDLQAVATDTGGRVDPTPTPITVTYTDVTPPEPATELVASVVGGDVTLTWSPALDPDLGGYLLYRVDGSGLEVQLTETPIQASLYLDSGLADDFYAYRLTAVDTHGNESTSVSAEAHVYTPQIRQPMTPRREAATELEGSGEADAGVTGELVNASGTLPLPPLTTDSAGAFRFDEVSLALGDNLFRLWITDDAGNVSKDAVLTVVVGTDPSPPTGLAATADGTIVDLSWNPNPEPDVVGYRPFRDGEALLMATPILSLTATASDNPGSAGYAVDGNSTTAWWSDLSLGSQWIEIAWSGARIVNLVQIEWLSYDDGSSYPAEDFDVEAWSGLAWVPLFEIRGNEAASNSLPLPQVYRTDRLRVVLHSAPFDEPGLAELRVDEQPLVPLVAHSDVVDDGTYRYHVTAVNAYAFESDPSAEVEIAVGDVEPPSPVVLSGAALGFDVELSWTASASPDVVRYDLYRDGLKFAEHFDLVDLRTVDRALPSATYAYTVRAVDGAGNESPDSNVVLVTVSMPVSFPLTVTTVPAGRALDLAWDPALEPPADRFGIWRADLPGGPYTPIAETMGITHRDQPLVDGDTYFYVVVALDAAGNAVASSNEAAGTSTDTVPPATPELHHPTVQGVSLAVRDGSITLVASTEPDATVEFLRDGAAAASAQATDVVSVVTADRPARGVRRLSPDGTVLWGLTDGEDDSDVWLLHHVATGQDEVVLEQADGARWTADSRRLVYAIDDGAIRAYDVGRRQFEDLAAADEVDAVAPSPDVERLAVFGTRSGQSGLWIVDLANGQWTQVSSLSAWNALLEWSPTGEKVAYRYGGSLYLLDVATGVSTLLTGSPGTGAPSWSPDGQAVLYPVRSGSVDQVWRHRLDLGTSEPITFDPAGASRPQWSPEGRRFAFLSGSQRVLAQDWLTGATEVLYESATSCSPCTLQWVAGGPLWIQANGAEWILWHPAGLAAAPATTLVPGLNSFTAVARDAAGNASEASLPISIEWDSAGAPDLAIAAADLTVLPGAPLTGGTASATITVRNLGPTASSPSDLLAFVQGPSNFLATLFGATALPALPPGGSVSFSAGFTLGETAGAYELVAAADPFHRVEEGDEGNNVASRAFPVVPVGGVHLAMATDRPIYLPDDQVTVAVEVGYGGEPLPARLEARIEDAMGTPVETVLDQDVNLEYGALLHWQVGWGTAGTFAGSYRAAAALFDAQGSELAAAVAPFVVSEGFELAAVVATDRPGYQVGELVRTTGEVHYLDGNTLLTDLEGHLQLFDPAGLSVGDWSLPIGPLLPGGEAALSFDWSSAGSELGTYRARWDVLRGGLSQAAAETLFELTAPPGSFSGELTLDSHQPPIGVPLTATLRVTNESSAPVDGATVCLRLVDPGTGTTLEHPEWPVEFVAGGVFEEVASFETESLESIEYLLILAVTAPAGDEETLAVETFVPVDRTAPSVVISQPIAGGFLGADDPAAIVLAEDERSGIAAVEARVDAGDWVAMTPVDPAVGDYRLDLSHLAEAPHQVEARATDGAGNATTTLPVDFIADWTSPVIEVSGVEDGGVYEEAVTPVVTISEAHLSSEEIRLDDEPFISGTPVEEVGDHLLEVEAEDAAGNVAELSLGFTILQPGQSLELVVNTVNDVDDGRCDLAHCSLREAITTANRHPSFDLIRFAIPGLGIERIISPDSALPPVLQPVSIDGLSQPGSACADPEPRPAVVLDGSGAGAADGLTLATWGVTLRGLTVRRFALHGLVLTGGGNHSISCSRLGDDGAEDPTAGNAGDGVRLEAGTSGNAIGADAESGVCEAPCNVIGFNGGAGVALADSAGGGNAIRRNHIHRNEGLGIDLGSDGLTANDPGDADVGPNGLQNFPQVVAVRPGPLSEADVVLQSAAGVPFVIDLFRVVAGNQDRSGEPSTPPFGEGDVYLGSSMLTTDALGHGAVTLQVPGDLSTSAVTATATDLVSGSTSEFSPVFAAHFTHAIVDHFRARVTAAGEGSVEWKTTSEAGTLGFDLYREILQGRERRWHRVNERL